MERAKYRAFSSIRGLIGEEVQLETVEKSTVSKTSAKRGPKVEQLENKKRYEQLPSSHLCLLSKLPSSWKWFVSTFIYSVSACSSMHAFCSTSCRFVLLGWIVKGGQWKEADESRFRIRVTYLLRRRLGLQFLLTRFHHFSIGFW